jgi:hypothetical protein
VADQYAKDAATGRAPRERLPEGYAEETSLAHMTRVATEARSKATTDWITEHVRPGRRYRPPPGKGVRRTQLRRVKKTLAGRYYQLLSGHAETGTHRHRFGRTDTPACWWCASGEPQSRHHLFTRCPAWRPQTRRLWKEVGEALGWKEPGPVGTVSVGGEGHGRRFGVFAHHEGGVRGSRESAPRGQGGGRERRGGGPRPALECTFPLSFPSGGC